MSTKLSNEVLRQIVRRAISETSLASTNPRSARSASMPPRAKNKADRRNPADEEVLKEFNPNQSDLDNFVDDPGAMHSPFTSRKSMVPPPLAPHGGGSTRPPSDDLSAAPVPEQPETPPTRSYTPDIGTDAIPLARGGYSETKSQRDNRIAREERRAEYDAELERLEGVLSGQTTYNPNDWLSTDWTDPSTNIATHALTQYDAGLRRRLGADSDYYRRAWQESDDFDPSQSYRAADMWGPIEGSETDTIIAAMEQFARRAMAPGESSDDAG